MNILFLFKEFSDICGALIIVAGLVGAVVAGIYVDSTKKFGLAGKVSFTLAVVFICLFYVVSMVSVNHINITRKCKEGGCSHKRVSSNKIKM